MGFLVIRSAATPAPSAPTLTTPVPAGTIGTTTTATVGATTNQNSGTLYTVVDTAGNIGGITAAQIKLGQNNASVAAIGSGNALVSTSTPTTSISGLSSNTAYSYAAVQNNANGDSNVVTGTFTTAVAGTFTKYVSSSGSNGNPGTIGSPYATIAFALSQITAGQSVGVLTNITETLALGSISGGSSGSANYKTVAAVTPGSTITGTASGTNATTYVKFQDFQWNIGTGEFSVQFAQFMVFIRCGITGGGGTSSGNVVQWICGSNQSYYNCYADGSGGRYAFLAFQVNNVLFNECVVRTQANVWGPAASNPTGGITVYSSTNVDLINCVAVDCLNQGSGAEWLGGLNFVSNVGAQTGVTATQCIVRYLASAGLIGIQVDGSAQDSVSFIDCCSVTNEYGAVLGTHLTGSSTNTFTRGEYSANNFYGIADFGSSGGSANSVNTTGNGSGNLLGISGSGNTTSALNMSTRIGSYKRIGTEGLIRGESGWNTPTSTNIWDGFPNETLIRTKFSVLTSGTRGFCGVGQTLTSWIKA